MALNLTARIKTLVRDIAPWVAGALGLMIGLHILWPAQLALAIADRSRTAQLKNVLPDARSLKAKADSLVQDSLQLSARVALAKSRQIVGSDPAAMLASKIVPLLGDNHWKLERVKADAAGGKSAMLDVGALANFSDVLEGLHQIRNLPITVSIKKLALRPNPSGKLFIDLQVVVPTREAP